MSAIKPEPMLQSPDAFWGEDGPELSFEELCEEIARTWVENGGDVDGFNRSHGEIRGWIVAVMAEMGRG